MLRKLPFSKPMLVLSVLILAALACYSDSPLWPYDLTEPPPSPTFLPTPDAGDSAKFVPGDIVIAPIPRGANSAPFLFLADYPENVRPDLTNSSGSCSFERELEILYSGRKSADEMYYLITCRGSVGWTNGTNLVGPVAFLKGQSALTTEEGAQGTVFPIHQQQPPLGPPTLRGCTVGEVVDILNVAAPDPIDTEAIWYQIRCSDGSVGWVAQERIFGPLVLPVGGVGLVNPVEVDGIPLTSVAGSADSNEVLTTCPANSVVTTSAINKIGDNIYYQLRCNGETGWTVQEPLVELDYAPGSLVLVFVQEPEVDETAIDETLTDETADEEVTDEGTDGGDGEAAQAAGLSAPLTANPGPASEENETVGQCPSESIALISQATVDENNVFFYNVTCGEASGWLDEFYILSAAKFELNSQASVTDRGSVGTPPDHGFYLSDVPKTVAGIRSSIGECQVDTLATTNAISFLEQAGTLRVYYQITCVGVNGEELTGWTIQDRLSPASVVSGDDSATSTGIFG